MSTEVENEAGRQLLREKQPAFIELNGITESMGMSLRKLFWLP